MMSPSIRHYLVGVFIFVIALALGQLEIDLAARLLIGILSLHFLWRACTFDVGSSHPIGLYLLFSGLYVFAAFSEVALFDNRLNLNPVLMGDLADMGVGFLICVAGGYLLASRKGADDDVRPDANGEMVSAAIYACLLLFVVCTSMTILLYGASVGTISRADLYSNDSSILTVLRGILAMGFGVAAALLVTAEKREGHRLSLQRVLLFTTLAAYVFVDLLILGDRRLPLMAMLGVGALMLPKRFTWPQIGVAAVLGLTFFIYGFVRNTPPSQWIATITSGDIALAFSPASTEFGGLAIIGQAIGNFDYTLAGFPTYLDGVLQLFPRTLIENRPLSPTEWFVQSYYPEFAAVGASFAFNQVIEARINMGIFGIVLVGTITGLLIALLSRLRYRGVPYGIPLCLNVFCFSMRMDMVSIARTAIVAALGVVFILLVAAMSRRGDPFAQAGSGQPS